MQTMQRVMLCLMVFAATQASHAQEDVARNKTALTTTTLSLNIYLPSRSVSFLQSHELRFLKGSGNDVQEWFMKVNLQTGAVSFAVPIDSAAKMFAKLVQEHYSAYCDSLRREIQTLRLNSDYR